MLPKILFVTNGIFQACLECVEGTAVAKCPSPAFGRGFLICAYPLSLPLKVPI
jgi:hypothetical protein